MKYFSRRSGLSMAERTQVEMWQDRLLVSTRPYVEGNSSCSRLEHWNVQGEIKQSAFQLTWGHSLCTSTFNCKNEATWHWCEPTCMSHEPKLNLLLHPSDRLMWLKYAYVLHCGQVSDSFFFRLLALISSEIWIFLSTCRSSDTQMDRWRAMHMRPVCVSTGGLNNCT